MDYTDTVRNPYTRRAERGTKIEKFRRGGTTQTTRRGPQEEEKKTLPGQEDAGNTRESPCQDPPWNAAPPGETNPENTTIRRGTTTPEEEKLKNELKVGSEERSYLLTSTHSSEDNELRWILRNVGTPEKTIRGSMPLPINVSTPRKYENTPWIPKRDNTKNPTPSPDGVGTDSWKPTRDAPQQRPDLVAKVSWRQEAGPWIAGSLKRHSREHWLRNIGEKQTLQLEKEKSTRKGITGKASGNATAF
jgi:hypothetical protein